MNVAGFLRSEMGIGEAARGVIASLDAAGVPVAPIHGSYIPGNRQGHEFACLRPERAPFPVNLICINPEELPIFLDDAGPGFVAGRYTIAYWWWEVAAFPERWLPAFDLVDEVWVGTEHVAENLRAVSPVPISKLRVPVAVPAPAPRTRDELGLPEGFLFLFLFDFNSIFERKNPLAVIRAFTRAFAPDEGAVLVLKSINRAADPGNYARLLAAAADHPGIRVIDRYMSEEDKDALIAACDCYVSLHRAEGFALTPAEAMYLGKPVVATRYSGNLEFMTDENSFLVDRAMVPIRVDNPLYPPDGEWAEPDTDHAARLMRQVFDDPEQARRRAALGARELREAFSPLETGKAMAARLQTICRSLPAQSAAAGTQDPVATRPAHRGAAPWRQLSLRQALGAIRNSPGHRRELIASFGAAAAGLGREWLAERGRASEKAFGDRSKGSSPHPLEPGIASWEILAQLRRQASAQAELRSRLAAVERRLEVDP